MSTDPVNDAMQSQIKNLETQTGRKLEDWLKIVQSSPLQKHGELVTMLKTEYGIGHGYANLLVHQAKGSFAGAEGDETDWVAEQYKGKENLKPWYDKLIATIESFGDDVELSPKKAYMSVRRKKQFAIIQPSTKNRLDLGLNLKGVEPSGMLEKSGSWNAMCTHRMKIEMDSALSPELDGWLKQAYEQAG
ncbi:DUF4287 domain-containing protein [Flavihumibacter sediminis]|nr:DUF4287 domain-containing protein [Flavihumibacter sediminis]